MSAETSRDIEAEGLEQELFRVAQALGLTGPAARAAVESALRRTRWIRDPRQARVAAFRRLGWAFLASATSPHPSHSSGQPPHSAGRGESPSAPPEPDPRSAFWALAPRHRLALGLVAIGGLRYAEAANVLNETEEAFAETLGLAREAFALRLAARGGRPRLRLVE